MAGADDPGGSFESLKTAPMFRSAPIILALLTALNATAQITALDTVPYKLSDLLSLENAGPKFIHVSNNGFDLYDPDLTLFLAVTYPPPLINYTYTSTVPMYVTESLFDTDPSTIEFILGMRDTSTTGVFGTRVLRS